MNKNLLLILLTAFTFTGIKAQFTTVDINPGPTPSNPHNITVVGSNVYFAATQANYGTELWISDGTAPNTMRVADINTGTASSSPSNLFAFGNKCLFAATDGTNGIQLWMSDGTQSGTKMVKHINPTGDSDPAGFTLFNGKVYFSANDGTTGVEPWVTDGTTAGTQLLSDINPGANGSNPNDFIVYDSSLYFVANNGTAGVQVWITDGVPDAVTTGGTIQFTAQNTSGTANPANLTVFNNKLFFTMNDGTNGNELWSTSGTTLSTAMFYDINQSSVGASSNPYYLTVVGGTKMFFVADGGTGAGAEPWVTDGIANATHTFQLEDIYSGINSSDPADCFDFNGYFVFSANDGTNGVEFWGSDGTSAGTKLIEDINPGSASSGPTYFFCKHGSTLFLQANTAALGWELYSWQLGNDSVTLLIPNVAPTASPLLSATVPVILGNELVFTANYIGEGNEIWFYDAGPAAIENHSRLTGLNVYPNPFTSGINISGLTVGETYTIKVTDITGREIMNQHENAGAETISLQLPNVVRGMYMTEILSNGASTTMKVIKQ